MVLSIIYPEATVLEGLYERLLIEFNTTNGFRRKEPEGQEEFTEAAGVGEGTNLLLTLENLRRKPLSIGNISRDQHEELNIADRSEKGYTTKGTSLAGTIDEEEGEEDMKGLMKQFFKEFTKSMKGTKETESRIRETRLVDFPTFKGELQDPVA